MDQPAKRSYISRLMACVSNYEEPNSPFDEQDTRRVERHVYRYPDAFALDLDKYEALLGQLLEKESWGEKFTEEYINTALKRLIRRIKEERDSTNALTYFTELVDEVENYTQEHSAYIPLSGIQVEVASFPIGNVTLMKMTEERYEDLTKKIEIVLTRPGRTQEHIRQLTELWLKDLQESVCAEYRCVAESNRVAERAEEECERIFDLFRYSIYMIDKNYYDAAVGRWGEVNRFVQSTPIISSDGQHFAITGRRRGPLAPFRITPDSIARMEQLGIFKVAEILKQPIDEKSFGEILLRGIRWFSRAQIQMVKENQYLNLTSCLETFLTPSDPNEKISNSIAEGVAFVLGNGQKERKQLKKKIKDLYNKRSRISHGGHGAISTSDLTALTKVTGDFLAQMIQRMDEFRTRKDLDEWIEDQKFA